MQPGLWNAGLAGLLLSACHPAAARSIPVSTDQELREAVASARPGDTILLRPGVYAPLQILKRGLTGNVVTITGKDARIESVSIVNSSGWALENLTIGGSLESRNRVVFIEHSRDIAVRNSLIHGLSVNNDPWDDSGTGVGVRFAQQITVSGNRFRDLYRGFVAGNGSDILFEGNSIAFVREGSNWASIRNTRIRCNRFSHIFPNWIKKEHPDAIQSWWNKGQGGNENVLIEGNAILTGGPRAVQGIFLAGSYKPEGDPANRMRNFTIRDNIYYGSSPHGITLSGGEGFVIERNTILPSPHGQQDEPGERSADGRRSRGFSPAIRIIGDISAGRIDGNIVNFISAPPGIEIGENPKFKRISNKGKAGTKMFATPPVGDDPPIDSFVAKGDQGARPICGKLLPPAISLPSGLDPSSADWPGN